jgi:hypothetical protein
MIDTDVIINIRKVVSTTGAYHTPTYSPDKLVYGTKKDAGAQEKERASASGNVNAFRVDINEEEYDNEIEAIMDGKEYDIYKTACVKNKVYLYLTDKKKGN